MAEYLSMMPLSNIEEGEQLQDRSHPSVIKPAINEENEVIENIPFIDEEGSNVDENNENDNSEKRFFYLTGSMVFIWMGIPPLDPKQNLKLDLLVLQIMFIFLIWFQSLYNLKMSPCGIYISMLGRIFMSFLKVTPILITTLLCFTFSFQLVMIDSNKYPWDIKNRSVSSSVLTFQAFTKITAMMTGEIEAQTFLDRNMNITCLLLIIFEVIVVTLLMNLMISLAVGDVTDLQKASRDKMFSKKMDYCIKMLGLLENIPPLYSQYMKNIDNVLIYSGINETEFSTRFKFRRNSQEENVEQIKFYPKERLEDELSSSSSSGSVDVVLHFSDKTNLKINDKEFKKFLRNIKDSKLPKFFRWLVGLNSYDYLEKDNTSLELNETQVELQQVEKSVAEMRKLLANIVHSKSRKILDM